MYANLPSIRMNYPTLAQPSRIDDCELCIVGAGLAGMNALFAACQYLTKQHKVVLLDARPRCGGMWTDTYDYVRLHQPHPMFTAGNIPWLFDRPPEHLASKTEVLDHFEHCLQVLRQKVTLVECFEHTYLQHHERETSAADSNTGYPSSRTIQDNVRVSIEARRADGTFVTIDTRRCIKAFGFRVPRNPPLKFKSEHVQSVAPDDPRLFDPSGAKQPVYVVGGGKTGMDTAQALIARFPTREVHLIVGNGTIFMNRTRAFPKGLARWWRGTTSLNTFVDLAMRFDGTNEQEVFDYFKRTYAIHLPGQHRQYVLGLLSEEENAFLATNLKSVQNGYVADVIDDGGPVLLFTDRRRLAIAPGSWFVNCTGYIMREEHPYEPYLSPLGAVVSIQPSSSIHVLTSFAGYFLTHLWYLDQLRTLPLYALDQQTLARHNRQIMSFVCMAQLLYNTLLIVDAVPVKVMQDCGLDFDRWFPLPRRLCGIFKLRRKRDALFRHCETALDKVRARYDLRAGVLENVARGSIGK